MKWFLSSALTDETGVVYCPKNNRNLCIKPNLSRVEHIMQWVFSVSVPDRFVRSSPERFDILCRDSDYFWESEDSNLAYRIMLLQLDCAILSFYLKL